jgi:hypothetical protein
MIAFGEQSTTEQNLLSVFTMALALVGFGFYTAFTPSSQGLESEETSADQLDSYEKRIFPLQTPPEDQLEQAEPVRLSYRPRQKDESESFNIYLEQVTGAFGDSNQTSSKLHTQIAFETSDVVRRTSDDKLQISRDIKDVRFDLRDGDRRFGRKILSQLRDAIPGAIIHSNIETNGYLVSSQWENVPNPQIERTLSLFVDAFRLFQPRFRRTKVLPGDEWDYKINIPESMSSRPGALEGKLGVSNQFAGIVERQGERLAVVRQDYEINYSGRLTGDNEAPSTFDVKGSGSGLLYFNIDQNTVHHQHAELERQIIFEKGGNAQTQTSQLRFIRTQETTESKRAGRKSE